MKQKAFNYEWVLFALQPGSKLHKYNRWFDSGTEILVVASGQSHSQDLGHLSLALPETETDSLYIYIYIKFCSVFHHLTCTFLQLYIQKKSVGKCRSSTNNHKWVKKQTHRKCCQVFPWAQLFKLSIWMTQEQKLWANQRRPPQTDLSVHLLIPRPPCQTSTTVKPSKSETGWEPEEELVDYSWHNRWVQGILGGGTAPRVEMRN